MPFTFPCPLAWGCCAGGAALLGAEGPRSPALEGARAPLGIWRGQEKPLHAPCTPQSRTRAAPLCCIQQLLAPREILSTPLSLSVGLGWNASWVLLDWKKAVI